MRLVNVLELGEQGFQWTISSGGTLEHGVAYAKVFPLFPGGVQQRCKEVADFAMPVLHVVREVEVAAALEPGVLAGNCLLYTSPSPRDRTRSRMPSSA